MDSFHVIFGLTTLTTTIITVLSIVKCLSLFFQHELPLTLQLGRVFHSMVLIFLISAYTITYFTDKEGGRLMWAILMSIPFVMFIPNALFMGADKHMPARSTNYTSTLPARVTLVISAFTIPIINYFLCRPTPTP